MLNKLIKKLLTAFWFLRRPRYIPQIFQILKRQKFSEATGQESLEWCRRNVSTEKDILKQITGKENIFNLEEVFPEIIQEAQNKAANCPVKMGGEGATGFLFNITKGIKAEKIIETGVAYGWSSLAILLAIKDNESAKLISNDMPYIKMNNDKYVGCIIPEFLKNKWDLQRLPDVIGIPLAIKKFHNRIDLCHYDSDKSYSGRMFGYPVLWNGLKEGGIFISDDIQDNNAFKHFAESQNKAPFIFEYREKFVGLLIK